MVLSPLLLQGWIPEIATFLNTPAWTMSAESFYYVLFPWLARWKRPERRSAASWRRLAGVWMLGLIPGTLYIIFNPDGIAHPDRWSYGPWLQALKYTPLPHLASFVFGVLLAELDELIGRDRAACGCCSASSGFAAHLLPAVRWASDVPYAIVHDGLLMPLFGCIILGLAGENPLAHALGHAAAGLCGRGQLLPLPAALQLLEPDPRHARARPAGPEPIRSLDQLRAADWDGAAGAALGGKAGAAATAQVDARFVVDR